MASIDRVAEKAGIDLFRDVPIEGKRRCRDWANLIGTARKLEAAEAKLEQERTAKITRLQDQVNSLQAELADANRELDFFRLTERVRELNLPEKNRHYLLTGKSEA